MEVLLGVSHVEEVRVLSSSEWVVRVSTEEWSLDLWRLDVPEHPVWDVVEDLLLSARSQRPVVTLLKVLNEVVVLVEEHLGLVFKTLIEILEVLSSIFLEILQNLNFDGFCIEIPDAFVFLDRFVLFYSFYFVFKIKMREILVSHFHPIGAVLILATFR